jgi:hypothetical protein
LQFISGEQNISKSFGILTSGKLSNKSRDADLKVLKTYTTDLPVVDRIVSLDDNTTWISSYMENVLRQVVVLVSVNLCVFPLSTTHSIMSLLLVTWIPVGCSGGTERNGLISPDFVNNLISELLNHLILGI